MKAIKVLKILNKYYTSNFAIEINEAIAELEALENINCDGCKYYLSENGNYPLYPCSECSRFYSDSWESK